MDFPVVSFTNCGLPEGKDRVPPNAGSSGHTQGVLSPCWDHNSLTRGLFPPPRGAVGLQLPECTAGGEIAPRAWPYFGPERNLGQR